MVILLRAEYCGRDNNIQYHSWSVVSLKFGLSRDTSQIVESTENTLNFWIFDIYIYNKQDILKQNPTFKVVLFGLHEADFEQSRFWKD